MRKRFFGMFLLALFVTQMVGITVTAAECSEEVIVAEDNLVQYPKINTTYSTLLLSADGILNGCIDLSYGSGGLSADFSTTMTKTASIVGVKDIKIYQSVWYGWKEVGSSGGGYDTNKAMYGCGVTYSGASVGQTFKASCVHYGIIDGVTYERPNETSGFTYVDPNN